MKTWVLFVVLVGCEAKPEPEPRVFYCRDDGRCALTCTASHGGCLVRPEAACRVSLWGDPPVCFLTMTMCQANPANPGDTGWVECTRYYPTNHELQPAPPNHEFR